MYLFNAYFYNQTNINACMYFGFLTSPTKHSYYKITYLSSFSLHCFYLIAHVWFVK